MESFKNSRTTLEDRDGPPTTTSEPPKVYRLSLGDTVHLDAKEYKIIVLGTETVRLLDPALPLFNKELSRSDFDRMLAEEPPQHRRSFHRNPDRPGTGTCPPSHRIGVDRQCSVSRKEKRDRSMHRWRRSPSFPHLLSSPEPKSPLFSSIQRSLTASVGTFASPMTGWERADQR